MQWREKKFEKLSEMKGEPKKKRGKRREKERREKLKLDGRKKKRVRKRW